MTPTEHDLVAAGHHHLTGPYWSDPHGLTWRVSDGEAGLSNGTMRATHAQINEVCAMLAREQLEKRRDGIYCPGCEGCEEGKK